MQLDVEESTPAMTSLIDFTPELQLAVAIKLLYFSRYELTSSLNFGQVTDRQKAMHKSPPCKSTGVLKNDI